MCLGTMTFGGTSGIWGQIGQLQQADADKLIGRAIDAGINFIDTANVYSDGVSETMTGTALKNLDVPRELALRGIRRSSGRRKVPEQKRRLATVPANYAASAHRMLSKDNCLGCNEKAPSRIEG